MTSTAGSVLVAATSLGSGLVGGVFFTFDVFVLRGLAALPEGRGAQAMRSINVAALRPSLMTALFGTAVLACGVGVAGALHGDPVQLALLTGGAVTYLVGAVGITAVRNVPLNNALAAAADQPAWENYLARWGRANRLRTVSSLVAAAALLASLVIGG